MRTLADFVGRAVPNVTDWQYLNLNYVTKARIDQDLCIKCGRCHIACEDTSHQAITAGEGRQAHFEVIDAECVGCNLCVDVCPVEDCITMEQIAGRRSAHRRAGTAATATGRAPQQPDGQGRRRGRWSSRPSEGTHPVRPRPFGERISSRRRGSGRPRYSGG